MASMVYPIAYSLAMIHIKSRLRLIYRTCFLTSSDRLFPLKCVCRALVFLSFEKLCTIFKEVFF